MKIKQSEKSYKLTWSFFIFCLVWLLVAGVCRAQELTVPQQIEKSIEYFYRNTHKNVRQKKINVAVKKIPFIIKYSQLYSVDPLIVSCTFALESSWKPGAVGRAGEIGLGQIMPGRFSKDFDLTSVPGQIEASVARFALAFDQCGDDLARVLTHYMSGSCKSSSLLTHKRVQFRIGYYNRVLKWIKNGKKS